MFRKDIKKCLDPTQIVAIIKQGCQELPTNKNKQLIDDAFKLKLPKAKKKLKRYSVHD
jgi:hypothetical protein